MVESLSISTRLNITAQIARLQSALLSGDPDSLRIETLELEENTRTALTEFGFAERIFARPIEVKRRRLADDRIETEAYYTDSQGRRSEDVFQMQENYITYLQKKMQSGLVGNDLKQTQQMLERAQVHLHSFRRIVEESSSAFVDSSMDGAVFLLSSLPPLRQAESQGLGVDSENGYALNGFYRVRWVDDETLQIDFRNFRSELSVWHHLQMMYRSADSEYRSRVLKLWRPGVRSVDVLKVPIRLRDRYLDNDFDAFLTETVYPRMKSVVVDTVWNRYVHRETQYLQRVLNQEEIASVLRHIQGEIDLVNSAMINNAPLENIKALIGQMQRQMEHFSAELLVKKDPSLTYEEHRQAVQKNSAARNDACPSQFNNGDTQVVEVLEGGKLVRLANGKVEENKDIECPACHCVFKAYDVKTGEQVKLCPNSECEYDPCTKKGKLTKSKEEKPANPEVAPVISVGEIKPKVLIDVTQKKSDEAVLKKPKLKLYYDPESGRFFHREFFTGAYTYYTVQEARKIAISA